jgi:hypothetical protein
MSELSVESESQKEYKNDVAVNALSSLLKLWYMKIEMPSFTKEQRVNLVDGI